METIQAIDVQQRMRQVMDALFPSLNAAARELRMNPGQLSKLLTVNKPGSDTLQNIAIAWGVPPFVFYMEEDQAAHYVELAKLRKK